MTRQALDLAVFPGHHQPIYRQIAEQIARAITARTLAPGDHLTPYRELAELLVVSPLAVRKAYEDLVAEGLCADAGGGDLRVAAPPQGEPSPAAAPDPRLSLRELQLAREVQCRLLPPAVVTGEGFEVAARNYPARIVAGDFYDVIHQEDGSVGVVVADVAGKGFGPSLIMATVKAVMPFVAVAAAAGGGGGVEETLRELNRRLHADLDRREFVALAYARLDPGNGRVRFADAGLPSPVLLRRGEDPAELEVGGSRLPLGLRPQIAYRAAEITLGRGDRLLFYTDGIPEAPTAGGELLGYRALSRLVRSAHREGEGLDAERWLDALLDRVGEATATPADDWTAVVIERT